MELSRQKYWSGLPFPSPGDLPDPGIKPGLLHCRKILYPLNHTISDIYMCMCVYILCSDSLENSN